VDRKSTDFPAGYAGKAAAIAAGLLLAFGACGSNSKKARTPTGSTGSVKTVGKNDGKPVMGNNVKTTEIGGNGSSGTGTTPPDGDAVTKPGSAGTSTAGGAAKPPPIQPPVREPTMAEVKGQLQRHLIAGKNALRQNQPNQAISQAKSALAVYSQSIDAVVLLAQAYYAKKLDDTAEVLLTDVLRDRAKRAKAEKNAGLYYTLGLIYKRTNRDKLAAKAFAKVVNELDSNHKGALLNLAVDHLKNKLWPEAQKLMERLVKKLGVKTAVTYNNLASAYRGRSAAASISKSARRRLLRNAEYYYKKALFVNKDYAPAIFNLGILYLDADPFPLGTNGNVTTLRRLEKAKTQFDDYMKLTGSKADRPRLLQKLARRRLKKEKKRLKKLKKKRKKRGSK